ncbi:family 10 glycosylhydrolase [candidate division KSB1 bacterium]|nr:family 10 glycosylhydrolase [candidate division KSB1 bacterium]
MFAVRFSPFLVFGLVFVFRPLASYADQPVEFRAIKITNVDSDVMFSDEKISEAMDYLASIGINVILPVVWNGSGADGVYTLYPSAVMDSLFGHPMHPAFPAQRDPLQRIIIEAHRNGMEVMPWFEMGFSTSFSQNGGHILEKFPDWALRDREGNLVVKNGFDWMSAVNPEVQKFILSLVTEVIDHYDVDGIEFSDRIPALPVEGGYDSATVAIYKTEHDGAAPPANALDSGWMRWRAGKLNQFMVHVRDSVKARSEYLVFSSSPSIYPWSYQEYLQDSKTWVDEGIVDNIIPQLYRYQLNDYIYELDKALGYTPARMQDYFYSGMLIRHGSWVISPEFFLQCMQANRDRGVKGEAFFFYEGLRANDDLLGDTLNAMFYREPALLPHRNGVNWRPIPLIVNEDDPGAKARGQWEGSAIAGYRPDILINKDDNYGEIRYSFQVPAAGWYDVYAYIVTGPKATDRARYVVYSKDDSAEVIVNQQDYFHRGWQVLNSAYLTAGEQTVLKLDNSNSLAGQLVVADAAMIIINRKLSPDVVISGIDKSPKMTPASFRLLQNYPNPFNATTQIAYRVTRTSFIQIEVFDVLGRKVKTLINEMHSPGSFRVEFRADQLASGVYMIRLQSGQHVETIKCVRVK